MNRRMFLRGAGATLWLPWLPSALPRTARAAAPPTPRRMLHWFVPNGLLLDAVTPTQLGTDYDLPPVLLPVQPLQSRVSVVSGLENLASGSGAFSTHEQCLASLLSDHYVEDAYGDPLDGGTTVDQFAAQQLSGVTPFASLQLSTGEPYLETFGNLTVYYNTLSWSGPQTPLACLSNPKTVFDRMFAGDDPTATQAELERRSTLRRSVLDAVLERTNAMQGRLNAEDRAKLDQFSTGVRELEVRIDALDALECPRPDEPPTGLGFEGTVAAMIDLMVVAFQCDYTRVLTFMTGPTTATTSYNFLGISTDHHSLSHNFTYSDVDRTNLIRIQQWQVEQWIALCTKLSQVTDTDGNDLLSNTMAALISEFSDSNLHISVPMTVLLAGGEAAGTLQGRHRLYGGRPHSDLWRSMLEFVGVDSGGFGVNATGPIDLTVDG